MAILVNTQNTIVGQPVGCRVVMKLPVDHVAQTALRCNPQRAIVSDSDGPHDDVGQPLPRGELHKMTIRETEDVLNASPNFPESTVSIVPPLQGGRDHRTEPTRSLARGHKNACASYGECWQKVAQGRTCGAAGMAYNQ